MKIKVIFTGGTIGSRSDGEYIGLGGAPYVLIERWRKTHGGVDFECAEPYSILSEELTAENLAALARCVREQTDGADAVIITHGTDTLVYTAAYLGFMFYDTKIPIVLVSSGYPLDDERANGHENFAAAVEFAKTAVGGVFAVWTADGEARVHLGVRMLIQQPYSDMIESVGGAGFALGSKISGGSGCFCGREIITPTGLRKIMRLDCCPEMYYPAISCDISAVLLKSYHSGTMCADSRLEAFVISAKEKGVPVFLIGANGRESDYETVKKYRSLGIIPLAASSPDAVYIKLGLAATYGLDLVETALSDCGGETVSL
ncbi:MAG: asparaginase domain-containing protein [Oscillospiraceae bacterium]